MPLSEEEREEAIVTLPPLLLLLIATATIIIDHLLQNVIFLTILLFVTNILIGHIIKIF